MPKTILLLSSATGGGHHSVAQAIAQGLVHRYGPIYQVTIADVLADYGAFPLRCFPRWYRPVAVGCTPFWQFLHWLTGAPRRAHLALRLLSPFLVPGLRRLVRTTSPDIIVSVHPLCTHLAVPVAHAYGCPLVLVITDLVSIHPFWLCPQVDRCCVPTEAARRAVLRAGVPPERVRLTGLPIGLDFGQVSKDEARCRLELPLHRPVILLSAGGERPGRVVHMAQALIRECPQAHLLIICGTDRAVQRRLESIPWESTVRVYGFTREMAVFMAAADVLITKAGPSTLAEAFASGLPIVLSGFTPEQERGNVALVVDSGAGVLVRDPEEIARTVARWLDDPAELARRAACSRAQAHPQAALEVAAVIHFAT